MLGTPPNITSEQLCLIFNTLKQWLWLFWKSKPVAIKRNGNQHPLLRARPEFAGILCSRTLPSSLPCSECSHALTEKTPSILHKFLCWSQQKNVCGIKADESLPSLGLIPTPHTLKRETELRKDEILPCHHLPLLSKQQDPALESIPGYSVCSESSCWSTKPPWARPCRSLWGFVCAMRTPGMWLAC